MDRQVYIPMPYIAFIGAYMGALVMAVVHGAKLAHFGPLIFDGGLIIYAMTFVVTDIVAEVYGKRYAITIVITGFFALIAAALVTQFAMALPAAPGWEYEQSYNEVLGIGARTMLAGICTFIISQSADLFVFSWLRQKTSGRFLWLRNNMSTIVGGGLDAVVFTTIAFYGIFPVAPIIATAFLVRVMVSVIDTPLVYLMVWLLRDSKKTTPPTVGQIQMA